MKFRLPYHLILEHDTIDDLQYIKNVTNPKLRTNHMINRCIKISKYIVRHAESDLDFKKKLDELLGVRTYKQFFMRGGI